MEPWTEIELRTAIVLYKKGYSISSIATILNRSTFNLRAKLFSSWRNQTCLRLFV